MVGRDAERLRSAARDIEEEFAGCCDGDGGGGFESGGGGGGGGGGAPRVRPVVCDMEDPRAVEALARSVGASKAPLNLLICNAGVCVVFLRALGCVLAQQGGMARGKHHQRTMPDSANNASVHPATKRANNRPLPRRTVQRRRAHRPRADARRQLLGPRPAVAAAARAAVARARLADRVCCVGGGAVRERRPRRPRGKGGGCAF